MTCDRQLESWGDAILYERDRRLDRWTYCELYGG